MDSREEKRAAFNEQMNEWVSRQGLWFQLRHAADGQTLMARMARVGLRLAIFLIIGLLAFWFYLTKRVESLGFSNDIRVAIESTLKGSECKLGSIRKERDIATISELMIQGGDESFFHSLRARTIRLDMELTDGLFGRWDGGGVKLDRLDMQVKAGGSDDAGAAKSYKALFSDTGEFSFEWIEADKASVRWGYSENNRGWIVDSHLSAARKGDVWTLEFTGGTFSQNWLKNLKIGKMVVICDKEGVHIKEAELHREGGTLTFQLKVGSGGQPQLAGQVTLKSMPMKVLLPSHYHDWISGVISGKGTIGGSTNSQEGVVLDLDLALEDGDVLVLRDTLPVLSALSVVDLYNSYRKVSFTEGKCHIRTGGNLLRVDHMDLRAGDLLHLTGAIDVRPPTYAEIAKALDIEDERVVKDVIDENWEMKEEFLESPDARSSVADAARGTGEVVTGGASGDANSPNDIRKISILAERSVRRFSGDVKVGLKRDAFDKAPKLKETYPVDEATGRIWMDVPMTGRLQTLTLDLAEKLYVLGRNRR